MNLALSYAYGVLEGGCRRAINSVWLEPCVGFLHETSGYQRKQSLVYDLQEPFRWVLDVAAVEAFESGMLDVRASCFIGDDYRYRFGTEAKRGFLELLRERSNTGVSYNGRVLKWDTIIEKKTAELGRYLVGETSWLDFSQPSPSLHRTDDRELPRRILSLSESEAGRLGVGKSTLHYLRKNASAKPSFRVCRKIRIRLDKPIPRMPTNWMTC